MKEMRFNLFNLGGGGLGPEMLVGISASDVYDQAICGYEARDAFYAMNVGDTVLVTSPETWLTQKDYEGTVHPTQNVQDHGNGHFRFTDGVCQVIVRTA